jgi:hypothetical protein
MVFSTGVIPDIIIIYTLAAKYILARTIIPRQTRNAAQTIRLGGGIVCPGLAIDASLLALYGFDSAASRTDWITGASVGRLHSSVTHPATIGRCGEIENK